MWGNADLKAVKQDITFKYEDYMDNQRSLQDLTRRLFQYGIAFISDVPPRPEAVGFIGTRIGALQDTIYGPTWDVRSVPSAKNVANTSDNLGFHMDLLYYKDPRR